MVLVLKNQNVYRMIFNFSYPFAPETYHHAEYTFGYVEKYKLVWANPNKKYHIGNKYKGIAFYEVDSVQNALSGGSSNED